MGQHTWFYKNKTLYLENIKIYEKLDEHYEGDKWLDEIEVLQLETRSMEIDKLNNSDYHDIFRTNKRNPDNTYTDDKIFSQKECMKWIEENNIILNQQEKHHLNEFWNEYPDGVIDFG